MREPKSPTAGKRTLSRGQIKSMNKDHEHRAERTSGGSTPEERQAHRGPTERAAELGTIRR